MNVKPQNSAAIRQDVFSSALHLDSPAKPSSLSLAGTAADRTVLPPVQLPTTAPSDRELPRRLSNVMQVMSGPLPPMAAQPHGSPRALSALPAPLPRVDPRQLPRPWSMEPPASRPTVPGEHLSHVSSLPPPRPGENLTPPPKLPGVPRPVPEHGALQSPVPAPIPGPPGQARPSPRMSASQSPRFSAPTPPTPSHEFGPSTQPVQPIPAAGAPLSEHSMQQTHLAHPPPPHRTQPPYPPQLQQPQPAPQPAPQPVLQSQHPLQTNHAQRAFPTLQHTQQPPPQQQPFQQYHTDDTPKTRPPDPRIAHKHAAIMDPPDRDGALVNAAKSRSYPSPNMHHRQSNPKFHDDHVRLTYALQQSLPSSVRQAVRDNWEKCLMGTDFHQAFVLNVALHHITPAAVKHSVRDFGRKLVDTAKDELVSLLTTAEIDELASSILSKASDRFLDMALDARLRTIEAKPLIYALARAERLGYEPTDIVEETPTNGQERVIPQHQPGYPAPAEMQPTKPPVPPAAPPVESLSQSSRAWKCDLCGRLFQYEDPYLYHMRKEICKRQPVNPQVGFKCVCDHCGQGFSTTLGRQYHITNHVCGNVQEASPARPTPSTPRAAAPDSQVATPSRAPRPPYHHDGYLPSQLQQTPDRSSPASASRPSSGVQGDPYFHLSEEQMAALNDELRRAELVYGERMREAEAITDSAERRTKLDGLKNSFGTRQSTIRKKYGVKLRERRTRAEIDAERQRMLGSSVNDTPTQPSTQEPVLSSQASVTTDLTPQHASPTPTPQSSNGHDAKRARVDDGGPASQPLSRVSPPDAIDDWENRKRKTPTPLSREAYKPAEIASTALVLSNAAAMQKDSKSSSVVDLSDSSSDNDDIPARLPAAVRQSLAG